jgi:hypothetical protein
MSSLAKAVQGEAYADHLARGGKRGSTARVVGVGLASLAICIGAIVGIAFLYVSASQPSKVAFGQSEVFYTDGATEAEAAAVGKVLVDVGYLSPARHYSVEVLRDHGRPVVAFVTEDTAFADEPMQLAFQQEFAGALSSKAFADQPIDLWLLDDELQPQVKLRWEQRPQTVDLGSGHTVVSRKGGTVTEAQAVGKALERLEYFSPEQPATVFVQRENDRHVVVLVVQDSVFDDESYKAGLSEIAADLSKQAFGGAPVDIWLNDKDGHTRSYLTWENRPPEAEAGHP